MKIIEITRPSLEQPDVPSRPGPSPVMRGRSLMAALLSAHSYEQAARSLSTTVDQLKSVMANTSIPLMTPWKHISEPNPFSEYMRAVQFDLGNPGGMDKFPAWWCTFPNHVLHGRFDCAMIARGIHMMPNQDDFDGFMLFVGISDFAEDPYYMGENIDCDLQTWPTVDLAAKDFFHQFYNAYFFRMMKGPRKKSAWQVLHVNECESARPVSLGPRPRP